MHQAQTRSGQSLPADTAAELIAYRDAAFAARREAARAADHDNDCAEAYRAMRAASGLPHHVLAELGFPPPPPTMYAPSPIRLRR